MRKRELTAMPIPIAKLPVDLATQRSWARIKRVDEDADITTCIDAAVNYVEQVTGKRYVDRRFEIIWDCEDLTERVQIIEIFNKISLAAPGDFQSFGEDDVAVDIPTALYEVVGHRLNLLEGFEDIVVRDLDPFIFTYNVEKQDPINASIMKAIKMSVNHWYENRDGLSVDESIEQIEHGIAQLLYSNPDTQYVV